MEDSLINITTIDGRYRDLTEEIRNCFSEFYLIKNRIIIEIKWLQKLLELPEISLNISDEEYNALNIIIERFDINGAKRVKDIEKITKHDVKAVEFYITEKLRENGMEKYIPFVHFGCTSEDINNLAYGLMIRAVLNNIYINYSQELIEALKDKAIIYSDIPMLSHTHGQPATPTTVGKEFAIYVFRMTRFLTKIRYEKFTGKFNGTVGNYNSFALAYPEVNWRKICKEFVESFGFEFNPYTTQIESHDTIAMIFSEAKLLNNVILDLNNDMWMYISRNYFLQENISGEIGSSVMPHKINPINFENSMANIKMANSMIDVFTNNLQISRMQRDLSDSSILRNIGTAFAYSIIAVKQTINGIKRITPNTQVLEKDLDDNPEILAEAIQTILRKNGYANAYNMLKELTRGKEVSLQDIRDFVGKLEINESDKNVLLNINPKDYLGLATQLAKDI